MTAIEPIPTNAAFQYLEEQLAKQKSAFLESPMPTAKERIHNLDKLHNAILDYQDRLVTAVNNDFSNRSEAETLIAEIYAVLEGIDYNRKRLKKWMKPQRRHVPLSLQPASVKVIYQPLGVIGIVVPWNLPIFLCLSPLVSALAAGNSVMIKSSEFAPQTANVIKDMLETTFSSNEVSVFNGAVEVSQAFTKLPFDHLVFTGATPVGKMVMKAAAENLTPVTLELGGKSPTIIHDSFPMAEAAKRIAFGKGMNGGQICVSPDYIFCPRDKVNEFASEFIKCFSQRYPTIRNNPDYTSVINERQYDRLQSYLQDAQDKGARLMTINPANESFEGTRKIPLTLVLNASNDMRVLNEEIFGPILPILPYDNIEEALSYINAKPRPLALYYFDWDKKRASTILNKTHSGGVCINDTLSHAMADDIPFGGIGPSGMGHYHGKEGFINFSKAKGVVQKGKINAAEFVAPPWNRPIYNLFIALLKFRFRRRSI